MYTNGNTKRKKNDLQDNNLSGLQNNVFVEDAIEKIRSSLGTKVGIKGNAHRGLLVIEYYSKETLEGIINKILN